jgi:hypothetical protein
VPAPEITGDPLGEPIRNLELPRIQRAAEQLAEIGDLAPAG